MYTSIQFDHINNNHNIYNSKNKKWRRTTKGFYLTLSMNMGCFKLQEGLLVATVVVAKHWWLVGGGRWGLWPTRWSLVLLSAHSNNTHNSRGMDATEFWLRVSGCGWCWCWWWFCAAIAVGGGYWQHWQ